jgi:putative nucleotidyltransferase-like protein
MWQGIARGDYSRVAAQTSTKAADIWTAVEALVDRAESIADLRAHRLHLIAARRWRALHRPVPSELAHDARVSAVCALTAPLLLQRLRDALDGPLIVLKGPEVAAHYPDALLRPFGDVDVLVPDAAAAQRRLIAAGFFPLGDPRLYEDIHHLQPLATRGLPLRVELHSAPKWPGEFAPPRPEELFEATVASSLAVDGVATLERSHHALVLAAHSWAHVPLRRVGELVDIAAMSDGLDATELRALAARWGLRKIWDTTAAAADALLAGGSRTWPLRTWARHMPTVRERTVLESHLERWLSGFWALHGRRAAVGVTGTLVRELRPSSGETLWAKLSRTRLAAGNALLRQSRHADQLERVGLRAPLFHELEDDDR